MRLVSSFLVCLLYTSIVSAQEKKTNTLVIENSPCGRAVIGTMKLFVDSAVAADTDIKRKTISQDWYTLITTGAEVMIGFLMKDGGQIKAVNAWKVMHGYLIFMLERINSDMVTGGKSADLFIKGVTSLQKADAVCNAEYRESIKEPPKPNKRNNMIRL